MGLNPDVILTKKEKFRKLFDDINKFVGIHGFFQGVYPNLRERLSEEQLDKYSELQDLFFNEKSDRNDPYYDAWINKAANFLKEILSLIPKPITFSNGFEMESFEKRYSFINNPEHDGSALGSDFSIVLDNNDIIKKHSDKEYQHIYGVVNEFDAYLFDFPTWLKKMGPGRYTINGFRFDVYSRYSSFGDSDATSISIYNKDKEKHPITKYVDRNSNEYEENEVDCHNCGDGGCPSCQPQWFI